MWSWKWAALGVALIAMHLSVNAQEIEKFSVPQGLPSPCARVLAVTPEGHRWLSLGVTNTPEGLVRITPEGAVTHWRAGDQGLLSDYIRALVFAHGALWVGSDRGLMRWNPTLSVFEVVAVANVHMLAATDTHLWAVGDIDDKPWALFIASDGTQTPLSVKGACRRDVALLANAFNAWWVCEDGLLQGTPKGFLEVPLHKTPLYKPPSRSTERKAPPIWIHAAALSSDNTLYTLSHIRTVSKRDAAGVWSILADADPISHIALSPAQQHLLAADFEGALFDLSAPTAKTPIYTAENTVQTWRLLGISALGCAWIEWQFPGKSVQISRWCPGGGPVRAWDLTDGTALSPGVIEAHPDPEGGLWITTNAGLWHLKD